ncbi:type I restriction enzyme S subunit [Arthrobacter sp. UYCu511]|uniref:restriction endonuclease subunit S n=1 Tax=unclassified Arthrobacter TaxID=235627 RepID=UPI0028F6CB05|nr:restriction endonuclease subunit S [Arthrobacter sp. lap29]
MNEWPISTVGFVSTRVTKGTTPKVGGYTTGGVSFVKVESITSEGQFVPSKLAYINDETNQFLARSILEEDDLLFSIAGTIGRVARVTPQVLPANTNQALAIIRPDKNKIAVGFLLYCLRDKNRIQNALSLVVQSVQANLSLSELSSIQIPFPPLSEQRAIAEVLGALDDKIAANTKLAATAHELAGHIYDCSTNPFDSVPMSDVLSPVLGGTPPRSRDDFWAGDQLWASAKDITGAEFSTVVDTDEKISCSAVEKTKAKPLPAGSVILTARGTVGAVARLAVPASFNQSCYGFVPGVVPPGVLYFSIVHATQRAKAIAHGSVFDTITMKTFDHLEFPDFEGDTMANTEAKIAPLLETITGAVLENHKLATTRDALLPQLMSGKLRVKDVESLVSAAV